MRVRVNVRTTVNNAAIRREQRNGRDVIIVPSATMPDNIVMNGIKYPADVIRASFSSLNRTPAPYGHPELPDGSFLSASDPEGLNRSWIGAWNENVRQEKDEGGGFRVHLDKVIDEAIANQSEQGRAVLAAINEGKPVHTSTGLYCSITECNDEGVDYVASDVEFDHDAILINEVGAAQPHQGVGMMVNSDGKSEEIKVFNCMLDMAERELNWAAEAALAALEAQEKSSVIERMKSAIREAIATMREATPTPTANTKDSAMDKEQFEALMNKVDALADDVATLKGDGGVDKKIEDAVANAIKPLTDQMKANADAKEAAAKAELDGLVEKIVAANILSKDVAETLSLNAAKELLEKNVPGSASGIAPGIKPNSQDDEFADFDMNAPLEAK